MPGEYRTNVDIANRALQRVGARRIAAFADNNKSASETSFCYDKLRRAELQRNCWTFACRRTVLRPLDPTVMIYLAPAYSAGAIYPIGSIVTFANLTYIALVPIAAGNEPDLVSGLWGLYWGPQTVNQWVSTTTFFTGELVYYPVGPAPGIYLSLADNNSLTPATIPAWLATTLYNIGDTVVSNATTFQSNVDVNLNQTPAALWLVGTTYAMSAIVLASDNNLYSSVAGSNTGHNPVSDAGVHWTLIGVAPWILVPGAQIGKKIGQQWLQLTGTVRSTQFVYPAGTGPSTDQRTRNVYILPNGFLEQAPQNPKAGPSYLGGPIGNVYDDWVYADTYFTSFQADPISFRFVADVSDVTGFDTMFCEGLSCRIAIEVCEPLTQSTKKLNAVSSEYNKFMGEARIKNAIEQGPTDSPEDDFISVRI